MTITEFRIEGLNPKGEWHLIAAPLGLVGDHAAHRDSVVNALRETGIKRYTKVRLAKYVTTIEVVGEDIRV